MDTTVELDLIGGFALTIDGTVIEVADPARRLLAFLALHRKPVPRLFVAGSLWPDKTESRALANLRSALWTLHGDGDHPVIAAGMPLAALGYYIGKRGGLIKSRTPADLDQVFGAVEGTLQGYGLTK